METEDQTHPDRRRKSLAIDIDTYEMLREICARERRTLISQLQLMIEQRHDEVFGRGRH
jgi:L-lactate utilization protein LutB